MVAIMLSGKLRIQVPLDFPFSPSTSPFVCPPKNSIVVNKQTVYNQTGGVYLPALLSMSCMTLVKLLNFSVLRFHHFQNWENNMSI